MNQPWCVKCGQNHVYNAFCEGFKVSDINERLGRSEIEELKLENQVLREQLEFYEKKRKKRNDYQRELMRKRAANGSR